MLWELACIFYYSMCNINISACTGQRYTAGNQVLRVNTPAWGSNVCSVCFPAASMNAICLLSSLLNKTGLMFIKGRKNNPCWWTKDLSPMKHLVLAPDQVPSHCVDPCVVASSTEALINQLGSERMTLLCMKHMEFQSLELRSCQHKQKDSIVVNS